MPNSIPVTLPAEGLRFAAPVALSAADEAGVRRVTGVAYGGGVITDHPYWEAVVIDLEGLEALTPMPLLMQHAHERVVGVVDQVTNTGAALNYAARLFSGIDEDARAIAAKADAGLHWQASVNVFPSSVDEIQAGESINGIVVDRAVRVLRGVRIREISICALGADATTSAAVFHIAGPGSAQPSTGDASMAEPTPGTPTPTEQIAALTAERDRFAADLKTAKAALAELQAQFAAAARAKREAEVKDLLGEAFSAEACAPYLDMTDVQFAAVKALKPANRMPADFTAERATEGRPADSVLLANARAMYGIKA